MNISDAYNLISQKLVGWLSELIRLLPNMLLAVIVLILGLFAARGLKRITHRIIHKYSDNKILCNLFTSVIYIFFIAIVIFTVLSILRLDKTVTSILAGAGIIGLALAFAFQDIAANFMSGIFISYRKPLNIGDIVKIRDYMGKVEEINLRDTVLRMPQGEMVIIPNKDVFQNAISNYTILGKRRFDLMVGVSYGDDLDKVRQVTLDAVKGIDALSPDDEVTMFYTEFGNSSINFKLSLWINTPDSAVYSRVGNEAIMRIKKAFELNDIMIPFPIRTLDLGIKGGTSLAETVIRMEPKEG